MHPHLHLYQDRKGEYRWTLLGRNNRKIACSGEGYKRFARCQEMALRICGHCLSPRGAK